MDSEQRFYEKVRNGELELIIVIDMNELFLHELQFRAARQLMILVKCVWKRMMS